MQCWDASFCFWHQQVLLPLADFCFRLILEWNYQRLWDLKENIGSQCKSEYSFSRLFSQVMCRKRTENKSYSPQSHGFLSKPQVYTINHHMLQHCLMEGTGRVTHFVSIWDFVFFWGKFRWRGRLWGLLSISLYLGLCSSFTVVLLAIFLKWKPRHKGCRKQVYCMNWKLQGTKDSTLNFWNLSRWAEKVLDKNKTSSWNFRHFKPVRNFMNDSVISSYIIHRGSARWWQPRVPWRAFLLTLYRSDFRQHRKWAGY